MSSRSTTSVRNDSAATAIAIRTPAADQASKRFDRPRTGATRRKMAETASTAGAEAAPTGRPAGPGSDRAARPRRPAQGRSLRRDDEGRKAFIGDLADQPDADDVQQAIRQHDDTPDDGREQLGHHCANDQRPASFEQGRIVAPSRAVLCNDKRHRKQDNSQQGQRR